MVGALPRVVQREVLLEDPGAEHERDRRHRDPVVMVGETDHEVGVALAERRDDREVQVLDLGRVGGGAVEHAELLVPGHDRLDGAVDVLQRPAARGQEHRFAERRDVAEKRDVEQIPGGELERVDVELGEQIGARLVERGGDERDALLLRVARQLEPVALRQLEELAVLAVGRAVALLVVVRRVVVVAREERAVVALLELHRVDPALTRRVDQRLRLLELALVVVPDLGDDVGGAVPRQGLAVDDQLAHGAMVLAAAANARRAVRSGYARRSEMGWLLIGLGAVVTSAALLACLFRFESAVSFVLTAYLVAWVEIVAVVFALSAGE